MKLKNLIEDNQITEAKRSKEEAKVRRDAFILLDRYRGEIEKSRKKLEEDMKVITAKIRETDTNDWGSNGWTKETLFITWRSVSTYRKSEN